MNELTWWQTALMSFIIGASVTAGACIMGWIIDYLARARSKE